MLGGCKLCRTRTCKNFIVACEAEKETNHSGRETRGNLTCEGCHTGNSSGTADRSNQFIDIRHICKDCEDGGKRCGIADTNQSSKQKNRSDGCSVIGEEEQSECCQDTDRSADQNGCLLGSTCHYRSPDQHTCQLGQDQNSHEAGQVGEVSATKGNRTISGSI